MEHKFYLRYYPKSRTIQFKPHDDKHVHFSVAWIKPMNSMDIQDFNDNIYKPIIDYLDKVNWKLEFQPIKACENCTYGHFDEDFEKLLLDLRQEYPSLCQDKDLPLDNKQHAHLREEGIREPIFMHMAHSRSNNEELNKFLLEADSSKTLIIHLSLHNL